MKMIIVLDKICLVGLMGFSLYVGYKVGIRTEKARNNVAKSKDISKELVDFAKFLNEIDPNNPKVVK